MNSDSPIVALARNRGVLRLYAAAAGCMDLGTGLGLIINPGWTLGKLRIVAPMGEGLGFIIWIGGFVAAVGSLYFLALIDGRSRRLRAAFLSTGVLRAWAGALCVYLVARGFLPLLYLLIGLTDLLLATFQFVMLRAGREDGE